MRGVTTICKRCMRRTTRDLDGTDFYADRLYWAFFYGLGTVE